MFVSKSTKMPNLTRVSKISTKKGDYFFGDYLLVIVVVPCFLCTITNDVPN